MPDEPSRVLQDVERVDAFGRSKSAVDLQPPRMSIGHAALSAPTAAPDLHLPVLEFVLYVGDLACLIVAV